jgi:glycosyltransferase involved in cell wall biosynthesis
MRVLQLNIDHFGTGADRCARELFEELPKLGVKTSMWVSRRRANTPTEVRAIRRAWEHWLDPLEAFPDLTDSRHFGSIAALRSISKKDFDLVHIHNIHSGWISIAAVRKLTERFPCVWTIHDEWAARKGLTYELTGKLSPSEVKALSHGPIRYIPYHRYHENYKWRRTRAFLDRHMPRPAAVICPSQYMKNLVKDSCVFPHAEIVHIANGTRMPELAESRLDRVEARRSLGLKDDVGTILMVSADLAQAHKGIGIGINAIKAAAKGRELQVVLIGSSAQTIAKLLEPVASVCMVTKDDAALAKAFRSADLTLIPSLGENFPYVAIESLACEVPIVAFPIGGMPEIIGKNERGMLCDKIDVEEMSLHIRELLDDDGLRHRLGFDGRTWVQQTCGMSSYLRNIAEIYENVLSGWQSH